MFSHSFRDVGQSIVRLCNAYSQSIHSLFTAYSLAYSLFIHCLLDAARHASMKLLGPCPLFANTDLCFIIADIDTKLVRKPSVLGLRIAKTWSTTV